MGDSRTVADRLAAAFPNARLLIVIREQEGMLLSWYKQYVRIGGSMSLRQYTSNPQIGSNAASFLFRFEILEYDRLIAHYHAAFSGNAPLVLPFELLAADPDAFVAEIARHAGADPPSLPSSTRANVSSSALATSLVRRGNRLLVREPRNVLAAGRATRANRALRRVGERVARSLPASARRRHEDRFTDEVRTLIGDRYAASNRRTAELTGLDLRDWGYKL